MDDASGAGLFQTTGPAYDSFMGRYSRPLATRFADAVGVVAGRTALDVGCGPGALTAVLVERLGGDAVAACDPSEPFVEACRAAHPGVDVRTGRAEALPFADAAFDLALSQLVLHFVADPDAAVAELRRVVRPGGTIAANVWDFADGMEMLRHFWDAALTLDPTAPDEARVLRFGGPGEIASLFSTARLEQVEETMLTVTTDYGDFAELWSGFCAGIGPAGSYCVSLDEGARTALRHELFGRCGSPAGGFSLGATARSVTGRVPA